MDLEIAGSNPVIHPDCPSFVARSWKRSDSRQLDFRFIITSDAIAMDLPRPSEIKIDEVTGAMLRDLNGVTRSDCGSGDRGFKSRSPERS